MVLDISRVLGLEAAGRADEAEAEYRTLAQGHPHLVHGWLGLARMARQRRRWQECVDRCDDLLGRFPNDRAGLMEKGRALEFIEHFDQAEEAWSQLCQHHPAELAGWLGTVRAAKRKQNWIAAIALCERLRTQFAGRVEVLQEYAQVLEAAGRDDEAERIFRETLTAFPDDPSGWLGLLRAARRSGDWNACVERADDVLRRFPGRVDVMCEKASALESLGQLDYADEVYAASCHAHPEVFQGWNGWARLAESRARWDVAFLRWEEVADRFPTSSEPCYGMIRAAYESGRFKDAAIACRRMPSTGDSSVRAAIEQSIIRIAGKDDSLADLAGALIERPQIATTGAPVLVVTGDSHVRAISDAAQSWRHAGFQVVARPFQANAFFDAAGLSPHWRTALASWSSAYRVFVTIQGNEHIFFGLAQHPVPYRTLHDSSKAATVPYLSWPLLRAALRRNMWSTLAMLRALACFLPGRMVILESTPPCPSERYMSGQIGSVVEQKVEQYGFASRESRMDLWRMRSEIILAECRKMAVSFLPCPSQSQDGEGFLVEAAWGDASHANAVYGRWVLEQMVRVAEGNVDELR